MIERTIRLVIENQEQIIAGLWMTLFLMVVGEVLGARRRPGRGPRQDCPGIGRCAPPPPFMSSSSATRRSSSSFFWAHYWPAAAGHRARRKSPRPSSASRSISARLQRGNPARRDPKRAARPGSSRARGLGMSHWLSFYRTTLQSASDDGPATPQQLHQPGQGDVHAPDHRAPRADGCRRQPYQRPHFSGRSRFPRRPRITYSPTTHLFNVSANAQPGISMATPPSPPTSPSAMHACGFNLQHT